MQRVNEAVNKVVTDGKDMISEIKDECNFTSILDSDFKKQFDIRDYIHVPYLPAFQHPGWMARYVLGPFDQEWLDIFLGDAQAGITVLLTLVPQVSVLYLCHCYSQYVVRGYLKQL
jgi:hypothetical protein